MNYCDTYMGTRFVAAETTVRCYSHGIAWSHVLNHSFSFHLGLSTIPVDLVDETFILVAWALSQLLCH